MVTFIFHGIFKFSMDLAFSCPFQKFKNFCCFRVFFTLNSSKDTNSGIYQNTCRLRCLWLYLYLTLSLPSHLLELVYQTKLLFSMTFKDRQLNSMTIQAWKMKFLNSVTFQVFYDLYEPCLIATLESLGQVEMWKPSPVGLCSHSISCFPKVPLVFLFNNLPVQKSRANDLMNNLMI